jgi:hypothetical protein
MRLKKLHNKALQLCHVLDVIRVMVIRTVGIVGKFCTHGREHKCVKWSGKNLNERNVFEDIAVDESPILKMILNKGHQSA